MQHLHSPQSIAKLFCQGVYVQDIEADMWRRAFVYIMHFPDDRVFQQDKIYGFWTRHGGQLRRLIKDDPLILNVIRKCFSAHTDRGLTLYRGECWFLFDQNNIGFCWTPSIQIAQSYAKGLNAVEKGGGVLLKCYAPVEAILAGPWLDQASADVESTYICDPSALLRTSILEYFAQT